MSVQEDPPGLNSSELGFGECSGFDLDSQAAPDPGQLQTKQEKQQ